MHCLRLYYLCVLEVLFILWGGSQDIRFTGGLSVYMPFTSSSLMVSNFALCAMPFLARFYFGNVFYEICEYVWLLLVVCFDRFVDSLLFFLSILFCFVWRF